MEGMRASSLSFPANSAATGVASGAAGVPPAVHIAVHQTSDGSFSAVWTATIASKDAFRFFVFRDFLEY